MNQQEDKLHGFLQYKRSKPVQRSVNERIRDSKEFTSLYPDDELKKQTARCMNCGVPFCHYGCPLGNNIAQFNDAAYQQNWGRAYDILSSTNNFPEFTGRLCPAPCESSCVLNINDAAVTIEEIEKNIIEKAFALNLVKPKIINNRTNKKVAVVGSGPAGLAVAAELNYAGHVVTVFEKSDKIGGLLRYGIPDFKLEKWVIDRRLNILKEEGIEFQTNAEVGSQSFPFDRLINDYNAIVLAGGCGMPRDLQVKGRMGEGVYFAMNFLENHNRFVDGAPINKALSAYKKEVVILGGGDTGSDCVGTCNRQGATKVTQLEIMPQPPQARPEDQPWPTYPTILRTTASHEEGGERKWSLMAKAIIRDQKNQVVAIQVVHIRWHNNTTNQQRYFEEISETEHEIPCQMIILAMGFIGPNCTGLLEQSNIQLDAKGNLQANDLNYKTNIHKVFATGDIRRGPSLIVWAIAEGRRCAKQVDKFLLN
ncbi:MAG: glutamate synthase subunit beta [Phycisphaerales bacterium]|nr:glutamate synthase subunit beta [Phycisphaerales bacterium]